MAPYDSSTWTGRKPYMPKLRLWLCNKYVSVSLGPDMMRDAYTLVLEWGKRQNVKEYECYYKHRKVFTFVTRHQVVRGYY